MRILHVLDHSLPLHSGYTFRTVGILREQRKLGWETFHLTSPKQGNGEALCEQVGCWEFFRTPMPRLPWMPSAAEQLRLMHRLEQRLRDVVQYVRPDVLHAHSPVLNAIPAIRVGRSHSLPVVYEIRAFWEDAAVDHHTAKAGGLRYRITRTLETQAALRADHVTTICEGLRTDLVARGIEPRMVTVVPNAVDLDEFSTKRPADEALLSRYELHNRIVLGFIGSFYAYEGLALIIDALPSILEQHSNVRLLLVGAGPDEDALRARAARSGVDRYVIFTGTVPHSEVPKYYDVIDLLVYPRLRIRLTELVTPLKPLEAMAQGRPYVASDVGGHLELIKHLKTGILFKAGDVKALSAAVRTLLSDNHLRDQLCTEARLFVERERTWHSSVSKYEGVYSSAEYHHRTRDAAH
jgi:PEP-CTERM/exosortase A-associated glycosyltransferase